MNCRVRRNDPCWCGSGIKYKKCHLNREKHKSLTKHDIYKPTNRFYSNKTCSVPDSIKHKCSKTIIEAHSVSKSSLKEIAKDGHVLTTLECCKESKNGLVIEPKKFGINRASTFTGFCSFHDNSLFSPIEHKGFSPTEANCFLVAYRAVAREVFIKTGVKPSIDTFKNADKGKNILEQILIQSIHKNKKTDNNLSTNDLQHIKKILDTCLDKQDFSTINHLVFTLDSVPNIMASSSLVLTFDFQGNQIQEISQEPNAIPDYLTINVFSSNGVGYVVLTWLVSQKKSCTHFYKSLMKTKSPSDSLTLFIFTMIENIYMSEEWWLNLSSTEKTTLSNAILVGLDLYIPIFIGIDNPTFSDTDALITDKKFEAFNIIKTESIGFNHESL